MYQVFNANLNICNIIHKNKGIFLFQ